MAERPTFEELAPTIQAQIERRRSTWRLASMDWEDAAQIIFIHVYKKYHKFDPAKGEFSHWLSKTISNARINILRDNFKKWSRPCIQGCVFNAGGDSCTKTKSGKQCDECILFKRWRKRKEDHFNVKQTLPLENHLKEIHSIQSNSQELSNSIDIGAAKKTVDTLLKEKLTKHEYQIYQMLYIQGLDEEEVGKILKYKKVGKMYHGYQNILKIKKLIYEKAKEIIKEHELAE